MLFCGGQNTLQADHKKGADRADIRGRPVRWVLRSCTGAALAGCPISAYCDEAERCTSPEWIQQLLRQWLKRHAASVTWAVFSRQFGESE